MLPRVTTFACLAVLAFTAAPFAAQAQSGNSNAIDCRAAAQQQSVAQKAYQDALTGYNADRARVNGFRQEFDTRLLAATNNGTRHLNEAQGKPYDEQWARIRAMEQILAKRKEDVIAAGTTACDATRLFTEQDGAGRLCYAIRARYGQLVNDLCGSTYQLQLNQQDATPLPTSWRELFRYQR